MKIFDVSMSVHYDMPVYKGKNTKRPALKTESDFIVNSVYESKIEMNLHTGTHVDAPLHMLLNGYTIDKLPLDKVVTKCKVLDLQAIQEKITKDHLIDQNIQECDFILLKTKNSFENLLEGDFVYLDKSGAEYLVKKCIKGVGIDALGIERNQADHDTHKLLFGADIVIIEGLRLSSVKEGEYLLVAAPINIAGAEAAPARALLIDVVG
ncbi:cyclase family protein [Dendrosporobacter sp. 1207_IL3150]|uniref:cyclase family protein n=1 Tax=Dendrosporobacter sp. 1207_IL3150 TaxID=3084054 RepID=UPI002FD9DC7A